MGTRAGMTNVVKLASGVAQRYAVGDGVTGDDQPDGLGQALRRWAGPPAGVPAAAAQSSAR
jgi:hypothetical protein